MQTSNFSPNDEMDDDDDDSLGSVPDTSDLGMKAPSLTPSEKIYLDGARDTKEYVTRMTDIARKKAKERERLHIEKPRQTPDDYIESLARRIEDPVQGNYGGPRIDATEEYMENLGRMYRQNQGIEDSPLPEDRRTRTAPAGPVVDPSLVAKPDDSATELENKIRAVEQEISQVSQSTSKSKEEDISADVMAKLNEMASLRESEATADDEEDALEMTLEEGARRIAELQRQIREEAGFQDESFSEPEPEPEPPRMIHSNEVESDSVSEPTADANSLRQSHVGKDPGTVDKQIEFLQGYLSRLEREAAEDPVADEEESTSDATKFVAAEELQATISTLAEEVSKMPSERTAFEGIENSPGEMTAEDKIAIFEELRRRAASEQKQSTEFADPFNVTLPERKSESSDPLNFTLPERNSGADHSDGGDEPSPGSQAEYDSFDGLSGDKSLLIEEIESEIKAYTRDVKDLLRKHETRLQVLLSRLRML